MSLYIENYDPLVGQAGGLFTLKPVNITNTLTVTGNTTVTGNLTVTGTTTSSGASIRTLTPSAVNTSATLTSAQVAGGYITSTSASAVTMTMPTGTLLGGVIGAVQGTTFDLYIDNTAGASTVTMAVGANGVQADYPLQITAATASVTPAAVTPLTIRSGTAGTGVFKIVFSSATAYTFSRTA